MSYRVVPTNKCQKRFRKCPKHVQAAFDGLLEELEEKGPVLPERPNYSKPGDYTHHCHLFYNWVAAWHYNKKKDMWLIEVEYVGSREGAPY